MGLSKKKLAFAKLSLSTHQFPQKNNAKICGIPKMFGPIQGRTKFSPFLKLSKSPRRRSVQALTAFAVRMVGGGCCPWPCHFFRVLGTLRDLHQMLQFWKTSAILRNPLKSEYCVHVCWLVSPLLCTKVYSSSCQPNNASICHWYNDSRFRFFFFGIDV